MLLYVDHVHLYPDSSNPKLDVRFVESGIRQIFPSLITDIRDSFRYHWMISDFDQCCESSRISDTHQPYERQHPKALDERVALYDGFVFQNLLGLSISSDERSMNHLHIVLTDLLTCTFEDNDWRYHARTVICGTPSIVSLSGIVEGPAKPREYYFLQHPGFNPKLLESKFAGKFIAYDDQRLSAVALGSSIQAIFYFITAGEPFCKDPKCRLYDAHWQQDLIRTQVEMSVFCAKHSEILDKFNRTHDYV